MLIFDQSLWLRIFEMLRAETYTGLLIQRRRFFKETEMKSFPMKLILFELGWSEDATVNSHKIGIFVDFAELKTKKRQIPSWTLPKEDVVEKINKKNDFFKKRSRDDSSGFSLISSAPQGRDIGGNTEMSRMSWGNQLLAVRLKRIFRQGNKVRQIILSWLQPRNGQSLDIAKE